jgi:subtilase family serine protease
VGALVAGQSMDISFKAKLPDSESNMHIIAQIDVSDAVSETDENNNIIVSCPL